MCRPGSTGRGRSQERPPYGPQREQGPADTSRLDSSLQCRAHKLPVLLRSQPQGADAVFAHIPAGGACTPALPPGAGHGRLGGLLAGLRLLWQVQLQDVVHLGEEGQEQLGVGVLHGLFELSGEL